MTIDKNSITWKAVVQFAELQRQEAIANLISNHNSEQSRGAIAQLDRLLALTDEEFTPVVTTSYDS